MAFDLALEQKDIAIKRQTKATQIFAEHLPEVQFQSQASSYHLWLTLPSTWQVEVFVKIAKEHGLLLSSGNFFEVSGKGSQCLRISLMAIADDATFCSSLIQLTELIKREPPILLPR